MNDTPTPTPETEAAIQRGAYHCQGADEEYFFVDVEVARSLERRLIETTAACAAMRAVITATFGAALDSDGYPDYSGGAVAGEYSFGDLRAAQAALQSTAGAELLAERDVLKAELKEAIEDRDDAQTQFENERNQRQKEVGAQEYRGNTVSYIYDKCANYGRQFDNMRAQLTSERELADRLGEALEYYGDMTRLEVPEGWDYPGMGGGPDLDQMVEADIGETARTALSEWREARK